MIALGYALALLIGLALGLLGGGGSILTVPVLHYVMGYPVKQAVPMSLVVVGLTSIAGAVTHARAGNFVPRAALGFGPPAIVGALLGAELGLRATGSLQLTVFAIAMLAASVSMFLGQSGIEKAAVAHHAHKPFFLIILVGGLVGVLTGFVGVGGGFLYVPTLVLLAGIPMKQAVGTSLGLIALSCAAGVLRYHGSQQLDWHAVALFTGVALVGVAVGTWLVRWVSPALLRRGFAVFLFLMSALVLWRGR